MKKKEKILFKLYIGLRYISQSLNKNKRSFIFFSLFLTVAIGLSVLIVVLSIMNGFQENHISRKIEIGSYHVSIFKKDNKFKLEEVLELKSKLYKDFKEIEAVVPYSDKEIIFKTTKKFFSGISDIEIIKLRAIEPEELKKDTKFNKFFRIEQGNFNLTDYSILIGRELAQKLSVIVNMDLYLTPDISLKSAKSEGIPFKIKGFYNTNSYEYDRYWGFISIYSLAALTGKIDIDAIGIKLKNKSKQKELVLKLKKYLTDSYIIEEAEEINKGYFAALKLEKALILFLFIMIFLMVSINTFSAIKLTIIEKKRDIAILKALGTTPEDIEIIYLLESLIIGFLGSLCGIIFGIFIAYNVSNIFDVIEFIINGILTYFEYVLQFAIPNISFNRVIIYDSSIYYQTSFLVKLYYFEIVSICFLVITMTIVAAYIPISKSSGLKPNEIIRS